MLFSSAFRRKGTEPTPLVRVLKKNIVMVVALVAALVTVFLVPPDRAYLDYFDFKTLTCLFCVLAVVCALKNVQFFYVLAKKIVQLFRNARVAILALVYITFIGSMLIANDMALLTFLPLGYLVLSTTDKKQYIAFTYIMQNIAANLGGMLTPFGNPQPLRERIRLWYDTNLHPGENYSTTIAAQLKTSDLFLLLVTPSVLEPDNYIARVEYPLARQEKKTVLPIVMRPTDRKALDALFPALPKCITEKQIGGIFGKLNT